MNRRDCQRVLLVVGLIAVHAWGEEATAPLTADADKIRPPSDYWALRPVARPVLPTVKLDSWSRTPIDRFILAKLEEKGLNPAPPADKATLLRRATFDLHGLPPTPAQLEAFGADTSPDAFAKVVDGLWPRPATGNVGDDIGWI